MGGTSNLVGISEGRHTWGNFNSGGIGNQNYIDTWVFANSEPSQTTAIISEVDNNDYGDAPDTTNGTGTNDYQTTSANDGASHTINNNLKIGDNAPDADNGELQNTDALADDNDGIDDEDGVTITSNNGVYTASIEYTNNSGSDAYLVGWIDFNKNGIFEDSEARIYDPNPGGAIDPIGNNTASTATLTWSGLTGLTEGDTYARFRLTTDINVIGGDTNAPDPQPLTALGDGEVEDYLVTINLAISGYVFHDSSNHDGIRDTGEDGISGVKVLLRNTSTNFCTTTVTDDNGFYSFPAENGITYEIYEAAGLATDFNNQDCSSLFPATRSSWTANPNNYSGSTTRNKLKVTINDADSTDNNFGNDQPIRFGACPAPAFLIRQTSNNDNDLFKVNLLSFAQINGNLL